MADSSVRATPSASDFDLLAEVIRRVAWRGRLSADDAQDFSQTVHLKLLERGYDVFHRFSGGSSLRTFLTVIIRRMLVDWQRSQYGKWRPSVAARRLGSAAVALETLLSRDGHTLDEAIEILRSRADATLPSEFRRIAEHLPARRARRAVPVEDLDQVACGHFDDPLEQVDRDRAARTMRRRLSAALKQLPREDRLLLGLRYCLGQRVSAIADVLQTDCQRLYRRCDKVLRSLRDSLDHCVE